MLRLGVEGRLVIAFTLAGGTFLGGLLVATLGFSAKMAPGAVLSTTFILFAAGTVLGWAHAVVLGCVGCPAGTSRASIAKHILLAGLCSLPVLALAVAVAFGIGISGILVRTGNALVLVVISLCWLTGVAVFAWAVSVGLEAFRNASARFPEARIGVVLLVLLLFTLMIVFALGRPEVWGTEYRVTIVGAVILAAGATVALEGPLLLVVHWLYRFVLLPHARRAPGSTTL